MEFIPQTIPDVLVIEPKVMVMSEVILSKHLGKIS